MRLRYWLFLGIVFCPAVNSALSAQTGQSESSAEEFLARIQQQIQAGDLRSARNELKQALSQLPRDPRLFNLLGVIDHVLQGEEPGHVGFSFLDRAE